MKLFTVFTFICVSVTGSNAAINLIEPRGVSPIEYGLQRSDTPRLRKRSIGIGLDNRYDGFQYVMNLTMGTPPQTITAAFDTGSSDLCVNAASNKFCSGTNPSPCLGAFDLKSSKTAKKVGTDPFITTYETTQYQGNWYSDTISFSGKTASEFIFGAADIASNGTENWFGVSFFDPLKNRPSGSAPPTNDSSLGQMVKAGIIPTSAYSIWMDRESSRGGNVLLGGVDTSKFYGVLQPYDIIPVQPAGAESFYSSITIELSSASVGGKYPVSSDPNVAEFPTTVLLDTGNPNLILPTSLVKNVYSMYGVKTLTLANGVKFGVCDCTLASSPATLDLGFPGLKISIPFSDLVIAPNAELYAGFNIPASEQLPKGMCIFMVSPTSPLFGNILGDNFMRYAYLVVDLDGKQVGLAQSNPTPGPSRIMELAANVTTSASASGSAVSATGTASATGTSPATPSATKKASGGSQLSVMSVSIVASLMGAVYLLL